MSWTLSFKVIEGQETLEDSDYPTTSVESQDAAAEAAVSAINLVLSGCYGDPDYYDFAITISGHSNPENKPVAGWSNDCVSINIVQLTEAK